MLKLQKKNSPADCISVVSRYSSDIGPGAYSGRSDPSDKKRGGPGGGGGGGKDSHQTLRWQEGTTHSDLKVRRSSI